MRGKKEVNVQYKVQSTRTLWVVEIGTLTSRRDKVTTLRVTSAGDSQIPVQWLETESILSFTFHHELASLWLHQNK